MPLMVPTEEEAVPFKWNYYQVHLSNFECMGLITFNLLGDKNEPAPTFEPLPATTILQRKASLPPPEPPEELIEISSYQTPIDITEAKDPYFDPFQTVFDKDPEEVDEPIFQIEPQKQVCLLNLQII